MLQDNLEEKRKASKQRKKEKKKIFKIINISSTAKMSTVSLWNRYLTKKF